MARNPIAPPPTRFGPAPAAHTAPSLQRKPGGPVPPPAFAPIRGRATPVQAKPADVAQRAYYGGGGMGGGYGYPAYGYQPIYYAPPQPSTAEIESALAHGEDHRLSINRNQPYSQWSTKAFPGFNIEFLVSFGGHTLKAHVKWNDRPWHDRDPYAMSLKYMDNSSLENPTQGSHPNLWRHLLHMARKIVANSYARYLLTVYYGSARVTRAIVEDLIATGNRQGLYALHTADATPLSMWDQEAWSLMLDWVTGG